MLLPQGDLGGARAAYDEGLEIARTLAARDPENADWAQNVVVSLYKVSQTLGMKEKEPLLMEALQRVLALEERGLLTAGQAGWPGILRQELEALRQ